MAFAAPSVGTLSRFGITDTVVNPNVLPMEYKTCTLGKHNTVLSTDGIRGTRSHPVERTRAGTYTVGGQISFDPGPADLDAWLPYITGGLKQGDNSFPLLDSLATKLPSGFTVIINRIAQTYSYGGCAVDKATFKASQSTVLDLTLDIEGKTETPGDISSFDSATTSLAPPYVLMDAVLTYNGTAYQFREVEITLDNMLKKDRFMNNISRTDLPALDRHIGVALSLPFTTDTLGLYDQNITSANVVITFTNGVYVLTFTLPAVQFPTQPPEMPGREEILLPLRGEARKTGTTLEATITNKSS